MKIVAVLLLCFVYFSVEAKELQDEEEQRSNLPIPDDIKNDAHPGDVRHRTTWMVDYFKKLASFKKNRLIKINDIKQKFWKLILRALHASHEQEFHNVMNEIDKEVFQKIMNCFISPYNLLEWARMWSKGFMRRKEHQQIGRILSTILTKLNYSPPQSPTTTQQPTTTTRPFRTTTTQ